MDDAAAPAGDDEVSAHRLLQRARRLLWVTVLPLLALVLLLAAWQARQQWQALLDGALAEARTQRHGVDRLLRDTEHHVVDLQRAQQRARRVAEAPSPAIADALQPHAAAPGAASDGHTLDGLPEVLRGSMGQLLWAGTAAPPPDVLQRAEALSAVMELAHDRHVALSSSFYVGLSGPQVVSYPWLPSHRLLERAGTLDLRLALQRLLDDDRVRGALPGANPTAQPYWLSPRTGLDGGDVLVLAAPVVVDDAVRGVVGAELRHGALADAMARMPGAPWQAWLLDEQGRVLAGPDGGAPLRGDVARALQQGGAAPGPGGQLLVAPLSQAPWTVVLQAPRTELLAIVLRQVAPYLLIVAALALAWLGAQALLRRRLVQPLVAIFGYLQQLSADAAAPEPVVGRRWQPWVQVVTRTFAALRRASQGERRAQALKGAIVDHALAAVVVSDEDDRIVEFNPAAEAMLGVSREQALGRTVGDLMCPPRFRDAYERTRQRMQAGELDGVMGRRIERIAVRADGSEFPVEVLMWMTRVDGHAYCTGSMTDLTAARAAAETIARQRDALRQSEKLSAMGSLLAGVAHELNNPLAIVMGRATLLQDKTEGTPLADDARRIRDAAERCGRIVRTFLDMARQRPPRRAPVQLNDVARAASDMLGYTLRSHGIELELRLDAHLPEACVDGDQVGQVVLNLVVNAQQALAACDGPRRITVTSGADLARGHAWLAVGDSGPGVPDALRESIFEPYFTTKVEGAGTGVGLSVSRAIAREHGGELTLDPARPGAGATFRLSLPLTAMDAPPGAPPDAASAVRAHGAATATTATDA